MVNTQLYLDPYCDGCPHFDAESEILELESCYDTICQVTITCTNASKCKAICEYLKKSTKAPRPAESEAKNILEQIDADVRNIKDIEVVHGALYVREFEVIKIIDKYMKGE